MDKLINKFLNYLLSIGFLSNNSLIKYKYQINLLTKGKDNGEFSDSPVKQFTNKMRNFLLTYIDNLSYKEKENLVSNIISKYLVNNITKYLNKIKSIILLFSSKNRYITLKKYMALWKKKNQLLMNKKCIKPNNNLFYLRLNNEQNLFGYMKNKKIGRNSSNNINTSFNNKRQDPTRASPTFYTSNSNLYNKSNLKNDYFSNMTRTLNNLNSNSISKSNHTIQNETFETDKKYATIHNGISTLNKGQCFNKSMHKSNSFILNKCLNKNNSIQNKLNKHKLNSYLPNEMGHDKKLLSTYQKNNVKNKNKNKLSKTYSSIIFKINPLSDSFYEREKDFLTKKRIYEESNSAEKDNLLSSICTFNPSIPKYEFKNKTLSQSPIHIRLYTDFKDRKNKYLKEQIELDNSIKTECNRGKTKVNYKKIEQLYKEYKLMKLHKKNLSVVTDEENGITYQPWVPHDSYYKNIKTNFYQRDHQLLIDRIKYREEQMKIFKENQKCGLVGYEKWSKMDKEQVAKEVLERLYGENAKNSNKLIKYKLNNVNYGLDKGDNVFDGSEYNKGEFDALQDYNCDNTRNNMDKKLIVSVINSDDNVQNYKLEDTKTGSADYSKKFVQEYS